MLPVAVGVALLVAGVATPVSGAAAATPPCAVSSGYGGVVAGTPGVVGFWRLGDPAGSTGACDSTGAGPGSYQGAVTPGAPGALAGDPDTAASFDGSTGWVSAPNSTALTVGDTFTAEAWIKRATVGASANQVIASKQNGSWVLMVNPSDKLVLRRSNVADVTASTKTIADTSAWHHVAATKNGSSVHLYIDGADVTGTVNNQTIANNTNPLAIGQSSGVAYYKGAIDEVAVYDRALTPTEITNHYNAGTRAGDPTIAAAGDIACSPSDPDFNGGAAQPSPAVSFRPPICS